VYFTQRLQKLITTDSDIDCMTVYSQHTYLWYVRQQVFRGCASLHFAHIATFTTASTLRPHVHNTLTSCTIHPRYFVAVLHSASANLTGFRVSGGLGADGEGFVYGSPLGESSRGGFQGFYKVGPNYQPHNSHGQHLSALSSRTTSISHCVLSLFLCIDTNVV
jgi:hypothetical protein